MLDSVILIIRLFALIILVILLVVQIRCIRVFRFELTVSEGLIITYVIAHMGLALSGVNPECAAFLFQEYLTVFGVILFGINLAVLSWKWCNLDDMTQAVIELLLALDVDVRFQMMAKLILNGILLIFLTLDLIVTPYLTYGIKGRFLMDISELKGDFVNRSNVVLCIKDF